MNKQEIDRRALLIALVAVGLLLIILAFFILNNRQEKPANIISVQPGLSTAEINSLNLALNLSYKTKNTYWKVADEFHNAQPFWDLYKIENDYVSAFQAVLKQLYLPIPKDATFTSAQSFSTLEKACSGLKIMEQDNVRLYGELLLQLKNQKAIDFINILIDRSNKNLDELRTCPQ